MLHTVAISEWLEELDVNAQNTAIQCLEAGNILYLPQLAFTVLPEEQFLLNPEHADPQSKNISYQTSSQRLWGVQRLNDHDRFTLQVMLDRFSRHAYQLVNNLLPHYAKSLKLARTSFRPVAISGRKTSYRKDDKRLHIDAFPSAPNQGNRILRVFSNINPQGKARVWRIGEPFEQVASQFIQKINPPLPGKNTLLRFLKITKSYRTLYDHYMLKMHDMMKADLRYQKEAPQQEIHFPSGSSWIVQTDHVSHAAMEGQHVLEQTFYLPIDAMQDENQAPLRILERLLGKSLSV